MAELHWERARATHALHVAATAAETANEIAETASEPSARPAAERSEELKADADPSGSAAARKSATPTA